MSNQTAVEWLARELRKNHGFNLTLYSEFEEAKKMFEEQIMNAHYEGSENYRRQYYKETFESGIGCPNCNEYENIHVNYDYSKENKPVESYLCNECGAFFTSKLN